MDVTLFSATGESKGKVELPASIVKQEISMRVLQEAIVAYQANQRRGTSDTKTRAEVSGGGHKPWRQKGTGNARSGSNRSPLWRKGGIMFGPHPRSYRIDLNEAKRRLALATAFFFKAQREDLSVLESLKEGKGKTSEMAKIFDKAVPSGRLLVVVDKKADALHRAIRNVSRISVMEVQELNAKALMHAQKIVFTKPALEALESRFPKG
jgi:large subunit ribosomal protein L4